MVSPGKEEPCLPPPRCCSRDRDCRHADQFDRAFLTAGAVGGGRTAYGSGSGSAAVTPAAMYAAMATRAAITGAARPPADPAAATRAALVENRSVTELADAKRSRYEA